MARSFTGTNAVNCGLGSSLVNLDPLTWWAWFVATDVSGFAMILTKSNSLAAEKDFFISSNGILRFKVDTSGDSADARSAASTLTANTPTFVAATWASGAAPKLYLGTLTTPVAEVSYSLQDAGTGTPQDDSTANILIGQGTDGDLPFTGAISCAGVIPRELSLGELLRLQYRGGPADPGVGYWELGFATSDADWSGNGNNGTVNGTTLATHIPRRPLFGGAAGWRGAFTAAVAATAIDPTFLQWWGGRGNGFAFGRDPRAGKPPRRKRRHV